MINNSFNKTSTDIFVEKIRHKNFFVDITESLTTVSSNDLNCCVVWILEAIETTFFRLSGEWRRGQIVSLLPYFYRRVGKGIYASIFAIKFNFLEENSSC